MPNKTKNKKGGKPFRVQNPGDSGAQNGAPKTPLSRGGGGGGGSAINAQRGEEGGGEDVFHDFDDFGEDVFASVDIEVCGARCCFYRGTSMIVCGRCLFFLFILQL